MTSPYSLGDFELKLKSALPPQSVFQKPNWMFLQESQLQALLRAQPTPAFVPVPPVVAQKPIKKAPFEPPMHKAGGPSSPDPQPVRAGEVGDVLDAVWKLPPVQDAVKRVQSDAETRLRAEWGKLSGGEKAIVSTQLGLMTGALLTGVLSHSKTRGEALKLISGMKVPAPGVEGLQVEFIYKEGNTPQQNELGGMIYFDLMPYLRKINP